MPFVFWIVCRDIKPRKEIHVVQDRAAFESFKRVILFYAQPVLFLLLKKMTSKQSLF